MRRSALPLLIAACVVVAAVLAWLAVGRMFRTSAEEPAGPIVAETRTPGAWTRLKISGQADVELVQGDRHEVLVEAHENRLSAVRTRVDDGTLVVTVSTRTGGRPFGGGKRAVPRIVVTSPVLERISLAGAIKVASRSLDVPSLRVNASGATSMRIDELKAGSLRFDGSGAVKAVIAGSVDDQAISLSGAGDFRAANLVSDTAKVTVAGAGRVVVNARRTLRVSLSGAGSVEYLGNPELTQSVSGLGRIKRRDADADAGHTRFRLAATHARACRA